MPGVGVTVAGDGREIGGAVGAMAGSWKIEPGIRQVDLGSHVKPVARSIAVEHEPEPILFAALVVDAELLVHPGFGQDGLVGFDIGPRIHLGRERMRRQQLQGVVLLAFGLVPLNGGPVEHHQFAAVFGHRRREIPGLGKARLEPEPIGDIARSHAAALGQ